MPTWDWFLGFPFICDDVKWPSPEGKKNKLFCLKLIRIPLIHRQFSRWIPVHMIKHKKNNLIIKTFQHLRNFLAVQISFLNGLRWLNFFCSQVWFILRRLPVLLSSGHTSNDQNWRFFGSPTSVSRSLVVGDASLILLQTQVVHEFGWSHMCLHWHVLTHPSIDLSWSANGSNMANKNSDLKMIW